MRGVDDIIPGIVSVDRSITFDGGGRWNNLEHVGNAHCMRIIGGIALVEVVVQKWIKAVGKSHGWVKAEG